MRSPAGHIMWILPEDGRSIELDLAGGAIDHDLVALWHQLIAALHPDVVVDVGANYGEMLLSLPNAVWRDCRLVALEPNPEVAACLRASLDHAGVEAEVIVAAAGARSGSASLLIDTRSSGLSRVARYVHEAGDLGSVAVDVVRVADVCGQRARRALLVKIDVEGNELDVLQGATELLQQVPAYAVVFEATHLPVEGLLEVPTILGGALYAVLRKDRRLVPATADVLAALRQPLDQHPFLRDVVLVSQTAERFLTELPSHERP